MVFRFRLLLTPRQCSRASALRKAGAGYASPYSNCVGSTPAKRPGRRMRDLYYPTRQAIPASIFQQIRALTLPTLGVSRCCTLLQGATGATREISDLAIHLGVAQPLHWLVFITAAGTGRTRPIANP